MILFEYRLQADSVRSASDLTEAVFLSSVTRLHCYARLASVYLTRIFVLMWTRLNKLTFTHWNYYSALSMVIPPRCSERYTNCLSVIYMYTQSLPLNILVDCKLQCCRSANKKILDLSFSTTKVHFYKIVLLFHHFKESHSKYILKTGTIFLLKCGLPRAQIGPRM